MDVITGQGATFARADSCHSEAVLKVPRGSPSSRGQISKKGPNHSENGVTETGVHFSRIRQVGASCVGTSTLLFRDVLPRWVLRSQPTVV